MSLLLLTLQVSNCDVIYAAGASSYVKREAGIPCHTTMILQTKATAHAHSSSQRGGGRSVQCLLLRMHAPSLLVNMVCWGRRECEAGRVLGITIRGVAATTGKRGETWKTTAGSA